MTQPRLLARLRQALATSRWWPGRLQPVAGAAPPADTDDAAAGRDERVLQLVRNAPEPFIFVNGAGVIMGWNKRAEAVFGWPCEQAMGRPVAELLLPGDHARMAALLRLMHQRGQFASRGRREATVRCSDGRLLPVEVSASAVWRADGPILSLFVHDISERRAAEQRQANSERQLRLVADNLPLLISYLDRELRTQLCNSQHRDWLGFDPQRLIGLKIEDTLTAAGTPEHLEYFQRALQGEEVCFESQATRNGVTRHFHTTARPDRLPDGSVAGVFNLTIDQTAQKELELQLARLARFDCLTGLPNRLQLDETLQRSLERCKRHRSSLVLMFVDIDHFKSINDSRGHAAGDAVLQTVAQRLREPLRAIDTVARLAGDEFVLLLEDLQSAADVETIADKLLLAVAQPIELPGGPPLQVTISLGVALNDGGSTSAAELLARADGALYEAKKYGRNTARLAAARLA
jgi:diguanylate cyclase (GGDEF)-like protein/PAS domain S-box-containing protein